MRHPGKEFEDDLETDVLPATTTFDAYAEFAVSEAFSIVLRGENLSDDKLVGLRLSWSLLEPGRAGSTAEAKANRRAAEAGVEALENEVTVRIISAWEELQAARQRLEVAERSLTQAQEAVRIVRDRYDEGLVTITEQLRAQTAVTRAELNHLAAIQDTTIGYARLLWATGRLENVEPFIR